MATPGSVVGPTQELCKYVARSQYSDLADEVVSQVKKCVLDALGCILGGSMLQAGQVVFDLFSGLAGKAEATIIPGGIKAPAINAAYVNSYLSNVMDFDDTDTGWGHPGACIVPPALAMAELTGASGRELINAVAVAYEVTPRVAHGIVPSRERMIKARGIGTHQIFGAVTASSILLRLPEEAVASAFGLAGVNAPVASSPTGRPERPLSWSKFNFGWAAMGGVLAAQLAAGGFAGNRAILDGDRGFWIMAGSDQCDFEAFSEGLGQRHYILGLDFKPYPCCRFLHSSLDAVKQIASQHNIQADAVELVRVSTFSFVGNRLMDQTPGNEIEAQFSLPHTVAMVLLGRPPGCEWLSHASLSDPQARQIARKVTFELDPEAEKGFHEKQEARASATIHVGGEEFTASVFAARGHPANPLSQDELEDKFRSLAIPLLGSSNAEQIIDMIAQLENQETVSGLTSLLCGVR